MASADDIAAALSDIIGKNDEEATVRSFLNSGFMPFNIASSSKKTGGFPVGRIIEIAGPPSSGKTALATSAMAAAQAAGGVAGFMDHERSFSLVLAPRLGLDVTPGRFVFKKPRTFEESITLCVRAADHLRSKKLIKPDAPICWVFDSLASMVPQSVLFDQKTGKERDAESRNMNDNTALARATSAHFPAFAQHCEELGVCAIFLNQTRTKIGVMYGDPTTTPGGDSPKFYASQRIMLSASQVKTKEGEILGNEVTARFIKNKVSRPFLKAKYRFMFQPDGTGRFDVELSTVNYLVEQGVLTKGRPGYYLFDEVQMTPEQIARKVQKEGRMKDLEAMMPADFEPEVMSEIEIAEMKPET
jgi:recombination protein RecA